MTISLRNLLLTKSSFRVFALMMGYWLWYCISCNQLQRATVEVPLCFYNQESQVIEAPETVCITMQGYKHDLLRAHREELAAHIDGSTLHAGENHILISKELLFLPPRIKLLHCNPSVVMVTVKQTMQNTY